MSQMPDRPATVQPISVQPTTVPPTSVPPRGGHRAARPGLWLLTALLLAGLSLSACEVSSDDDDSGSSGSSSSSSSSGSDADDTQPDDVREAMRTFVQAISEQGKEASPGFLIIPQNGADLTTLSGDEDDDLATDYLDAIDGQGQEDLFYGYEEDDEATPTEDSEWLTTFLDIQEDEGVQVLVTDYVSTEAKMDDSYSQNAAHGYASFAADHRDLDNIPDYPATPNNVHSGDVTSLADVQNFLYVLDPSNTDSFADREDYLATLAATNYDLFIIDAYYDDEILTADEVEGLKTKANGGARLVVSYMSIGEAEDYRFYWNSDWENNPPAWLDEENPDWEGNYKVHYWNTDWQDIILDEDEGYLSLLLDAGFDGTYLDIIDAFEFYE